MESLIGEKELKALIETRNLLDELLETLDILSDEDSMKKLVEAKGDVDKGRLHGFRTL